MNFKVSVEIWLFLSFLFTIKNKVTANKDTLVLVHALFRHGDRTPDILSLYASSPYYDESNYAPYGYGQLTNKGKLRVYKVGVALRERYNGFLDQTYNVDLIEPRSSYYNRTKESLQAMLAGLFPPTKNLIWLEGFNWQPIATNYAEKKYDKEMYFISCPNWNQTMNAYFQSKTGISVVEKYQEMFRYISYHVGENITSFLRIFYLYFGFAIQKELNFTLPEWTNKVYPYPLRNFTEIYYDIIFTTEKLRKMAGYLLKKMIIDTRFKIEGKLPKKKMFIYSGHEINLVSILKVAGSSIEEIPPYGSYILLELHKIKGIYGFKLFYQDYSTDQPILLTIPQCGEFCHFEKFVSLTKYFLPEDDNVCGKRSVGSSMKNFCYELLFLTLFINIFQLFN